jgi:hypothetical protein
MDRMGNFMELMNPDCFNTPTEVEVAVENGNLVQSQNRNLTICFLPRVCCGF